MSVVKSKQTEGKLLVVTKARELAAYTIKICSNEKNFPKRYRWCITAKIVDCAIDVSSNVNAANSIYVNDDNKKDYQLRRQYQTKALAETYALLSMIDIAYIVVLFLLCGGCVLLTLATLTTCVTSTQQELSTTMRTTVTGSLRIVIMLA